ncbi:MAG TPA: hypothetical protein VGQ38_02395 [Gaiellaceae bacterium]|jgi:hypothetical protein|nr:hypothetical protein [Gaiellaceae bacterium]
MDSSLLIVAGRRKPKLDSCSPHRKVLRKEVGLIDVRAVSRDHVDLAWLVEPMDETGPRATAAPGSNLDGRADADRPFALDAQEPRAKIEDEVVPLVADRLENAEAATDRLPNDCLLGNHALLICRQHHPGS